MALDSEPVTITELMARNADLGALSNQKVSALVNALVDEGKVTKTVEKRKSYFALA
jgi:DNA-binding transcriptional regulator GbsR (MarR family)